MSRDLATATEQTPWKPPVVVVATVLVLAVGPFFGPVPHWLDDRYSLDVAVLLVVVGFLVTLGPIAAFLIAVRARTRSFQGALRDVGLLHGSRRRVLIAGVVLALAWGLLGKSGVYAYEEEIGGDPDFSYSVLGVLSALLGLVVSVAEDVVTRGFVMNSLDEQGRSVWMQLFASAAIFALYHSIFFGRADGYGVFVFSLIYGLLLGGLFLWGNRSLWPVIVAHGGALLIGEPQLTQSLIYSLR